jgi:6-pyruvoyltetrahydropterin/6-carboxytetrahydropterin synthase
MEIFKDFSFEAAHRLPNLPAGHKCSRLHGHSFHVRIFVSGNIGEQSGWIIDFGDIKKIVNPLIDELDHNYLNDINGLENPTCENIGCWLWQRLSRSLPGLSKIMVQENTTSGFIYSDEK